MSVSWLLCGDSSQCYGFGCSLWLWYSLTIFGCHSCEQRWLWRVCTFAWSSLSFRQSSKFSCGASNGDWMPFCASSEGSGESAHLHRFTLAFVTVQNILCCLKWRFVCYSRQQRILLWVCTFAQEGTGQCYKYQDILCWQQRLLGVCTFAQARLSLLYSIEISWAGWNGDFCNVYCELRMMWWVCTSNHRTSVKPSVRCINALKKYSQCVVIKFLNKTFASVPRKKIQNGNRFWMLFHGNMTTAALRHADFPQFRQLH